MLSSLQIPLTFFDDEVVHIPPGVPPNTPYKLAAEGSVAHGSSTPVFPDVPLNTPVDAQKLERALLVAAGVWPHNPPNSPVLAAYEVTLDFTMVVEGAIVKLSSDGAAPAETPGLFTLTCTAIPREPGSSLQASSAACKDDVDGLNPLSPQCPATQLVIPELLLPDSPPKKPVREGGIKSKASSARGDAPRFSGYAFDKVDSLAPPRLYFPGLNATKARYVAHEVADTKKRPADEEAEEARRYPNRQLGFASPAFGDEFIEKNKLYRCSNGTVSRSKLATDNAKADAAKVAGRLYMNGPAATKGDDTDAAATKVSNNNYCNKGPQPVTMSPSDYLIPGIPSAPPNTPVGAWNITAPVSLRKFYPPSTHFENIAESTPFASPSMMLASRSPVIPHAYVKPDRWAVPVRQPLRGYAAIKGFGQPTTEDASGSSETRHD